MNIDGQELSKEQIERAQRIGAALLSVVRIEFPEDVRAITSGLGAFLEMAYLHVGYEATLEAAKCLLDVIVESRPAVQRVLNGPPLTLVPSPAKDPPA